MRSPYQALLANPEWLAEIHAAARRERALAVHRYLIAPLARLFAGSAPLESIEHTRTARRPRVVQRTAYC